VSGGGGGVACSEHTAAQKLLVDGNLVHRHNRSSSSRLNMHAMPAVPAVAEGNRGWMELGFCERGPAGRGDGVCVCVCD
jgi:hypothetical protein